VGQVLPELDGKLDGMALRVPVPTGSVVDLVCEVENDATEEAINDALIEAANGPLKGILRFTDEPIVSSDIIGDSHSSIVDGLCTKVLQKRQIKVISWYDNEWGFSCRMADLIVKAGSI
jgi:glyceraldehyde 3-phosphate dehydrogenase